MNNENKSKMKVIILAILILGLPILILSKKKNTHKGLRNKDNDTKYSSSQTTSNSSYENQLEEETEAYEWKDYDPLTTEEYKAAFIAEGLVDKWPHFKTLLKPEIRIKPKHIDEHLMDLGKSKLGGSPDLPSNVQWPTQANGKHLAFLAQINFQEIELEFLDIPEKGIIYFFYDEAQEFWGYSKENSDSYRTIFVKDPTNLERRKTPEDFSMIKDGKYRSCKLKFSKSYSLPNWEHEHVRDQFIKIDIEPYIDIASSGQYTTKLFGHSINVQGLMEYECEMVDRGYTWDNTPKAEKPIIIEASKKWKLLFQLDSESEANMMWGDVGRLYFWIKEDDLNKYNFDKTWMILQCH